MKFVPADAENGKMEKGKKWHMNYCVYILASKRNGTLYIGVTSDLAKRVYQHKSNVLEGFTKRYHVIFWSIMSVGKILRRHLLEKSSSKSGTGNGN